MIKQTFYNLPQEKKERIINAIVKEIGKKNFTDISINQIVKNAEISRGSFYQYFDDKADIFHVVLEDFRKDIYDMSKKSLIQTNGDIFKASLNLFDYVVRVSANKAYSVAFKTVFSFINYNNNFLSSQSQVCPDWIIEDEIKQLVNIDLLSIESENDIDCIIDTVCAVLTKSWFEIFVLQKDIDDVKNKLNNMFLLMKNGFYRR